jgi:S1-C subfamily serine protease
MILFPFRRSSIAAITVLTTSAALAAVATPCDAQPREEREVRIARTPAAGMTFVRGGPANRAVLGVTLAEGSRADTAGVRLESVAPNSPAAKAGLKAGDVITDINGVSLKVSREDAEDPASEGLAQRRLQRVMGRAKPGDDVKLQVRSGTATRAVTVKAAAEHELEQSVAQVEERIITRSPDWVFTERNTGGRQRGAVGVTIGSAGNARDTLGLFVNSVVTGGAAEKAGIIEGERIAAVNGMDVRVPREDVDDDQMASARVDRFVREIQKTEPGQTVAMRVWGNGRYRDVTVTVQKAEGLPGGATMGGEPQVFEFRGKGDEPQVFEFRGKGDEPQLFEFRRDRPARGRIRINGNEIEIDGQGIERAMEEMGRRLQDRMRDVEIDVRSLRTLPERSGAVRIRSGRAAV